ncbi:MAG: adenylyltransferase/cytidyltransferase family protein [Aequorivita sp.]
MHNNTKIIGYTTGVFDLFHLGHLNILKNAKENCDYLIVGVTVDEMVSYKGTDAIVPFEERFKIVEAIRYVDKVVPQTSMNKMAAWEELHFNKMFVGSDWKGSERWNEIEKKFAKLDVEIQYFPYTKGTSSTHLKNIFNQLLKKSNH